MAEASRTAPRFVPGLSRGRAGKERVACAALVAAGLWAAWCTVLSPQRWRSGPTDGERVYGGLLGEGVRDAVWLAPDAVDLASRDSAVAPRESAVAPRDRAVAPRESAVDRPAISPDGRWLVFASGESGIDRALYAAPLEWESGVPRAPLGSRARRVAELDSPADETAPAFGPGALYFASDREGGAGGLDLYRAEFDDGSFGPAEPLGAGVNGPADESDPAWSEAQGLLVFASNRPSPDATPSAAASDADWDLYVAATAGAMAGATPAMRLESTASPADEREPSLGAGGRWLCFASDREGGAGAFDLYRCAASGGEWLAPERLADLSSAADERAPLLLDQGFALLFARQPAEAPAENLLARSLELHRRPAAPIGLRDLLLLAALLGLALLAWLSHRWEHLDLLYKCYLASLLVHVLLLLILQWIRVATGGDAPEARAPSGDLIRIELEEPSDGGSSAAFDPTTLAVRDLLGAPAGPARRADSPAAPPALELLASAAADATPQASEAVEPRAATARAPELADAVEPGPAPAPPESDRFAAPSVAPGPARASAEIGVAAYRAETAPVELPGLELASAPEGTAESDLPAESALDGAATRVAGVRSAEIADRVLLEAEPGAQSADARAELPLAPSPGRRRSGGTASAPRAAGTGETARPTALALGQVELAPAAVPAAPAGAPGAPASADRAPRTELADAATAPSGASAESGGPVPLAAALPLAAGGAPARTSAPAEIARHRGAESAGRAAPSPLALADRAPAPPAAIGPSELPQTYRARSGAERLRALEEHGGGAETEAAVARGLAYLAGVQHPNGLWGEARARDAKYGQVAIGKTGLALLAFLGAGHTPASAEHGEVVRRAIDALLARQDEGTGHFGDGEAYSHGVASFALAECFAMTRAAELELPVRRGVQRILAAQDRSRDPRRAGGWTYYYADERVFDPWPRASVTAWQVMALSAARLGGIDVPGDALDAARSFLLGTWDEELGAHRYEHDPARLASAYPTLPASTPAALFALALLGEDLADARHERAVRFVLQRAPQEWRFRGELEFVRRARGHPYFWYVGTLAMFRRGGGEWERWNERMKSVLLGAQDEDGSWPPIDPYAQYADDGPEDKSYTTALAVLTLEIYYRYFTPLLASGAAGAPAAADPDGPSDGR